MIYYVCELMQDGKSYDIAVADDALLIHMPDGEILEWPLDRIQDLCALLKQHLDDVQQLPLPYLGLVGQLVVKRHHTGV